MVPTETVPVPKELSAGVLRALRRRRPLWRFLIAFCRTAEEAGGASYLVGGIVRDLIEGLPGRDVDLMVTGIGFDRLGDTVRSLPPKSLGIRRITAAGREFAVYKVSTSWSREDIDVALARTESSTGPGHRQFEVRTDGIDARGDAARRDFTINSLMVSFRMAGSRLTGDVVDFFGGLTDLRRKRIRGVGVPRDRIREDPLRMLRAIRQKNERPGTAIEKGTWEAICREARLIGTISGERLVAELGKSLAANPSGTMSDLHRAGMLRILIPEIKDWSAGPLSRMKKRYAFLERALGRPLPETVLFANLLVDIGFDEFRQRFARTTAQPGSFDPNAFRLPATNAVARRLHFPGVRNVVRMIEDLARLSHHKKLRNPLAQVETIFRRWKNPESLHALYSAARLATSRRVEDFRPALRSAARRPPLLTGSDILALGIPPGPQVLSILEEVREATLTRRVRTRKEAEKLAVFLYGDETLSRLLYRGRRSRKRESNRPARARKRTKLLGTR